jgi:small subunit ribosomal protein S13
MVLLFGLTFNSNLPLLIALQAVPGVGRSYGKFICKFFGVSPQMKLLFLSRDLLKDIHRCVIQNRPTGPLLSRLVLNNIRLKIQLKTYQGYRHLEGLPVHGQNTKSNASTSRLLRKSKHLIT